MLCEAFRRLRFGTTESYQYVGFGSVYFADFALFHRALGIDRMISIEKELHDRQRFLDNRPFANIDIRWGTAAEVLPGIDLTLRSIVWLDYDGRLSSSVLDDVRSVATRAISGSALVVTVQARPTPIDSSSTRKNINALAEELGQGRVDPVIEDKDLLGWGTARVFRQVIINEIQNVLSQRNGIRPIQQRLSFEQVFNFHYKDGAHMLTVGGVFFDEGQRPIFEQCALDQLDFVRRGAEPFNVGIPLLTNRELRHLECQLPLQNGGAADFGSMPASDGQKYINIYRYFPNFTAVDL